MSAKEDVLEEFEQIVGKTNVLTDPEDLFVYSLEHFFRDRQHRQLDIVVRATSREQMDRAAELAKRESLRPIRRQSTEGDEKPLPNKSLVVLLDDVISPELTAFHAQNEAQKKNAEKELYGAGHGTLRNLALALKSFFSSLPSHKCLECRVCSGYCTVSPSFNGIETWSSKGRTILTQALSSSTFKASPKVVDVLYTCSLCGLCFAECFEGTQIRKAIMTARHSIAKVKRTPELFTATARNIFEAGDPSGMPPSKRVAWTERLQQKGNFPKRAKVLYWAGCVTSTRTPNTAWAFGEVLNRAKVDFTYLGEKEGCCGYVLLAASLWDEAKENAERLFEKLGATKAEAVVMPCAGCYYTFTKLYPEILELELPCQVFHAAQYLENLVEDQRIVPHDLKWKVTYHDPCSLGRHSNVYNSPRRVLNAVPSLDFVEMPLSRNRARCCGAGGGLWSFNNSVAINSAVERLARDVVPMGVSALVTACPTCHINLRYASVRKSMGIKVYDLTEVVEAATSKLS